MFASSSSRKKSLPVVLVSKKTKSRIMQVVRRMVVVLAVVVGIAAMSFVSIGLLLSLPASKPQKADVIVVLGGDKGLRVQKGAELYNDGFSKKVLLTGIDRRYYRPSRPNWRERRIRDLGVKKSAIVVDTKSQTSWEEAMNTAATMERRKWESAIVVSDPPHMLRLWLTWHHAFAGTSKRFTLVATKPDWWHPIFWWKHKTNYKFVVSELKKNIAYVVFHYIKWSDDPNQDVLTER
uniref:DUF218 domain-containing protein n=1 Tax=Chlorobium chlorochromatii (strain CaD3) TaxID=340177 RepID=Q3AQI0_CHLCH